MKVYECFLPEALVFCYVKASSEEEAESKVKEKYNLRAICKDALIVPSGIKIIE